MEVTRVPADQETLADTIKNEYVDRNGTPHKLDTLVFNTNLMSDEQLARLTTVTKDFLLTLDSKTLLDRFGRLLPGLDTIDESIINYYRPRPITELLMYDELNPTFNFPRFDHGLNQPEEANRIGGNINFYLQPYIVPNAMLSLIGVNKRPLYLADRVCEIALTVHQSSQSQGLGRRITSAAVDIAAQLGYKYVYFYFDKQGRSSDLIATMPSLKLLTHSRDSTEKYYRIGAVEPNAAIEAAIISEIDRIDNPEKPVKELSEVDQTSRLTGVLELLKLLKP